MLNRRQTIAAICLLLLTTTLAAADPKTLRVYHVGNSVTDTINYHALKEMAQSRGHTHTFGRHMIPGAPLQWIWEHPESGFKNDPFGYYPDALPKFTWDAITLQPFDRHLKSDDGSDDVTMAKRFINLILKNPQNGKTQFYIYSRWPRRDGDEKKGHTLDYEAKWLRKYTGGWDGTNETRDYFERLVAELRKSYPMMEKPLLLVPVGDVLLEIHRRGKAGKIPGMKDVAEVYHDGIHFNNVGSFIVGTTFFATLYKENPKGLKPGAYGKVSKPHDREISDDLALAIQQAVWDIVSKHPLAGVASPDAHSPTP